MNKKFLTAIVVVSGLLAVSSSAFAQRYYYPPPPPESYPPPGPERGYGRMGQFDLSFSIGEGSYVNYRCDVDYYYCHESYVAPFEFELLAGYRLTRFLSLDLALNFSFDYWGYNYYGYFYNVNVRSQVYVWTSLRPGIRIFLPTMFHYQVYFRAAVPLTFRVSRYNQDDNVFLPGLLLGVGVEWILGSFGFFLEGDILPYFVAVYPDYYAIPVEGRIGVVAHF